MVDVDLSAIGEKVLNYVLTSTNVGMVSSGLIIASAYGNWWLWQKLKDYKVSQEEYEKIFIVLEPILTKIINEEKISPAEIEDVKQIRGLIKFKFVKK
jgi:hypothetical protein